MDKVVINIPSDMPKSSIEMIQISSIKCVFCTLKCQIFNSKNIQVKLKSNPPQWHNVMFVVQNIFEVLECIWTVAWIGVIVKAIKLALAHHNGCHIITHQHIIFVVKILWECALFQASKHVTPTNIKISNNKSKFVWATSFWYLTIFVSKGLYSDKTFKRRFNMLVHQALTFLKNFLPLVPISSANFVNSMCHLGLWKKKTYIDCSNDSIQKTTNKWDNVCTTRFVRWLIQWIPS
jgi:hypothetical protein